MLKLIAIGNLGRDAELKEINGNKLIDFSIAHTERFTSNGTPQERTIWVRCSYWTDRTTLLQYLKKGTQVYVEGNPTTQAYTNKDGNNVADLRLRISNLQLLGSRNSSQNNSQSHDDNHASEKTQPSASSPQNYDDIKDDLPF